MRLDELPDDVEPMDQVEVLDAVNPLSALAMANMPPVIECIDGTDLLPVMSARSHGIGLRSAPEMADVIPVAPPGIMVFPLLSVRMAAPECKFDTLTNYTPLSGDMCIALGFPTHQPVTIIEKVRTAGDG